VPATFYAGTLQNFIFLISGAVALHNPLSLNNPQLPLNFTPIPPAN
jgi:hypothetical protein